MEKIKNNLPIILVSLSSLLFVVAILLLVNANIFKSSNSVSPSDTNNNDTREIKDNANTKEENNNVIKPTPTPTSTPNNIITKSEETIINYFQSKENELKTGDEKSLSEKAKEGFINVVDFIFYDKEVKGYTFKELTNNAKLKVISIALSMDSKIDTYFPNYKDKIKGTYSNIKEKLVVKYLEYTEKLCETVGEETCNSAKENWEILKKNFSITGDYLKNLGITGSDKLKDWYENWKNK